MLRPFTDNILMGGQITAANFDDLKARGIKSIINNRPDGEAPGQPSGEALGEAAKQAGFSYAFIPMHGLDIPSILASVEAYDELPKPALAFCASGTRSAVLWCFASVNDLGIESVLDTALKAGYDLHHMRPALQSYKDQYC